MARRTAPDRGAMAAAIAEAREGIEQGQSPFGCCIVRDDRTLALAHNTVWQDEDPSAHAEVNAIREACRRLGTIDLSGCVLYATCEPCPMCFAAAHWARVSEVVYGAGIGDAVKAGFSELEIPVATMRKVSGTKVRVRAGFMQKECRELFGVWARLGRGRPY